MDKMDEYVVMLIRSHQPDTEIRSRVMRNVFSQADDVGDFWLTNRIFDNTFRRFAAIWDKQLAAL